MTTEERFNEIYEDIVNKNLIGMESTRAKAQVEKLQNYIILVAIIIINILVNFLVNVVFHKLIEGLTAILIMSSIVIYLLIIDRGGKSQIKKFKIDFKTKIVDALLKSFNQDLVIMPRTGIHENTYKEADFENYDKYSSEDLVVGTINNNCNFKMAEVLTQKERIDNDGGKTYTTIFKGLFTKISAPKQFGTLLYLRNDVKDKGFLNRVLSWKLPFDKLRVELDSSEFEKIFDVYASDKIRAMQLLTADIMEDLIEFYNEMKINYELTIKENYIYIRFWCGNMFEAAKLRKFALDKETLYKYYRMLDFIFKLTDKMLKALDGIQYN